MRRREPTSRLLAAAETVLARHGEEIDLADATGSVSARSRLLCAALAELAVSSYAALGGRARREDVACAAGLLSLLTKIDDQVIDGLAFHGGPTTDRAELAARCRAFLAPTLRAVTEARALDDTPRSALAATLGAALRALGGPPSRRAHLLSVIAHGWEVQVRAVVTLTAAPETVSRAEVERVTREISGAWLLMITLVGTLPDDAARALSADEEAAFEEWGGWIQRADALSDLGKDLEEGLIATLPVHQLLARPERAGPTRAALARRDAEALYRAVAEEEIDLALMPPAGALAALEARLGGLGEVGPLLSWIHGLLTFRYLADPRSARDAGDARFLPFVPDAGRWTRYLGAVDAALTSDRSAACSAP